MYSYCIGLPGIKIGWVGDSGKYELTREPGELIVVPPYATVGEQKEAVQSFILLKNKNI